MGRYEESRARSLPIFLYMLFISVARSSSGMLTIGRIAYPREWVFFPIDNALYSIAFRTRTKTAKPIDMPFGVTSGLGQMIRGGDDPRSRRGKLGKTMCPTSLNPFIIATSATKDRFRLNLLIGSRPSDHYFRSVSLTVCLFVCAEVFTADIG